MSKSYSPANYAPVETRDLKHSPKCVFYFNGDKHYSGSKFCVSNRIRTLDGVKDELTKLMCKNGKRPGYVRNIYTPNNGTRITGLDEFRDGEHYVASINDKFEHLRYREIPDRLRPARHKRFKKIDIDRIYKVVHHAKDEHYRQKSAQCLRRNAEEQGLLIRVSVNGRKAVPSFPVSIKSTSRKDIEAVKIAIQETMHLEVIKRIYKVTNCGGHACNFCEVTDSRELNRLDHVLVMEVRDTELNPCFYSHTGLDRFKCPVSPRHNGIQGLFPPPEPVARFPNKYSVVPSIASSKQSEADTMSPFSNPPGSHGGRKTKRSKGHREVDYDKDEAGVFRAKKQNNSRGAHQVNDSKETRTEKPIDQMEAETVDEEEIRTKEKTTPIPPGTDLNKQPSQETKQNADKSRQAKTKAEVKKGGKSGKDLNKVSVLPPIVDSGGKEGDAEKVKRDGMKEIKDGHMKETVDKYEGKAGEGIGVNDPFVDEKEVTPKDLKTDDVIEITERELTPVEFQSNDVEVNKPPLSTTPPQGKLSQASGKLQEKVDEDASPDGQGTHSPEADGDRDFEQTTEEGHQTKGMHRIDEYNDDSFNRYDQNTSRDLTRDPRSSTPASRDEEMRKRQKREHEAATKIQAGAKGYKARKDFAKMKEAKKREEEHKRQQEKEAERFEEDSRQKEDEARNKEKKQIDEHEAATKIQAQFKGYKTRKAYKTGKQQVRESFDKQAEKEKEIHAATKIQNGYRGYIARKNYNNKKKQMKKTDINDNEKENIIAEENAMNDLNEKGVREGKMSQNEAAVAIQAGYKGYKTRKEYSTKKSQREKNLVENEADQFKNENAAASKIQANFRGYKVRKDFANEKKNKEEKEAHQAATKIQANFRGYRSRKQNTKKKEPQLPDQAPSPKLNDAEELNKAATKIQSGFRGMKARKYYKSKVIVEHTVETDIAQLPDSAVSRSSEKIGQFIQGIKGDIASKIQSAFRVYHAKKLLEKGGDFDKFDLNKNREADEIIIAAYKGFRTRRIEKENFEMKNKAALKIQTVYKGYKVRKTKIYHIKALNLFHAAVRGYITRKLNNIKASSLKVATVANGDYFAGVIQALCKGFLTRYTVRKMKENSKINSESATSPQGPTAPRVGDELDVEVSYWKDTNIKMYSDKTLRKASSRIQSVIYAYKTRKLFKDKRSERPDRSTKLKEMRQSVAKNTELYKIQSCFKGYLERHSERGERAAKGKGERAEIEKTDVKDMQGMSEVKEEVAVSEFENRERGGNDIESHYDVGSDLKLDGENTTTTNEVKIKEYQNERNDSKDTEFERNNCVQVSYKENLVTSDEKDTKEIQPHPPSSLRPTSARPLSSKIIRQGTDRSKINRRGSKRTISGRPVSGKINSSAVHECTLSKVQTQSWEYIDDVDSKDEVESMKKGAHTPRTEEETMRSSTRLSRTDNSVVSESILSISDITKQQRRGSARSYSTWKSSEKIVSSGGEIEREGESLREIEDDAGELSSMERNVNAVSQLQAAFRAYKLRREISELMSGGAELMDIKTIDRAVSALRKDFRLRSAKVRRLGSYQFDKDKPNQWGENWWERDDDSESTDLVLGTEEMEGQESERGDVRKVLPDEDECLNESDSSYINGYMETSSRIEGTAEIKAAMKAYLVRKVAKERRHTESKEKIEAAYRGYRTRETETRISTSSSRSGGSKASRVRSARSGVSNHSERTVFHVQMHSDVINDRCTRLQAAFSGYLTRKVFISLTKLVQLNRQIGHDTSGHQLERMGSLSETDDFKLRHKTIAKIQATYESYRASNESKGGPRQLSKDVVTFSTLNKHTVLPPIQQNVHLIHNHSSRPKSGVVSTDMRMIKLPEKKSKTQPNLGHSSNTKTLNNIELYVKKKMAATVLQAHAQAHLTRSRRNEAENKQKSKEHHILVEKTRRKQSASTDRTSPVSVSTNASKTCLKADNNKDNKESRDQQSRKKEDKTMTDMVRVRTASIKLEAERRKALAETIRVKQQTEAGETVVETKRIKSSVLRSDLTPIKSSRLLSERSNQTKDMKLREEKAAVQIQKVYRGHRVRQNLDQKTETQTQLDKEYSVWKTKRNDAAVTIQSAWRGYSVRRQCSVEEDKRKAKLERGHDDFSHLEDSKGLIVINIGRSKSEIERANRKYDNASLIQMIFRACKVRRKLAINGAKRRLERKKAASKIQALYKGYWTRHKLNESVSATRIQSVFKAHLTRDNMQERMRVEEEERRNAASYLQAAYLSFRKRRENEVVKKERRIKQAIDCIQSTGKGFIVRWEKNKRREGNQMKAALRIQSSFLGQKDRKKMAAWKESVIVINAAYKSYKTRQMIQALKDKQRREMIAATRLQAAYKAYKVRSSNKQYKEKMDRQNKATSKIQCSFKGRKARTEHKRHKEIMEMKRHSAALKIQSLYRGHRGRKIARRERHILDIRYIAEETIDLIFNRTIDYAQRRTDSGERIQATVKAYNTRRQVAVKLTSEAKQRMHYASVIQAALRATIDRKQTYRKYHRNTSATIIQSVFRAMGIREQTYGKSQMYTNATIIQSVFRAWEIRKKQNSKKLLELMDESATKIQSLYRGHRTRSEIQKEREMIANLEPPPAALISARTRSGKLLSISVDEVLLKNSRAIILFHKKATELQEAFRAYLTRKEMRARFIRKTTVEKKTPRRVLSVSTKLSEEDKAAILIQKTFRGYWNRNLYNNAMAKKRKQKNAAATNIQAAVKGFRIRVEEKERDKKIERKGVGEVWRMKQKAANIISFAYKSFRHRKVKQALRVEM